MLVIPGVIDDQVHFREPGLTHKANIYTEAKAAVAGGVTSFMENAKHKPASGNTRNIGGEIRGCLKNGVSELLFLHGHDYTTTMKKFLKTDPKTVCGIKIFMGSSTGDMLVDDDHILSKIFANAPTIIALHCEDEQTIKDNTQENI